MKSIKRVAKAKSLSQKGVALLQELYSDKRGGLSPVAYLERWHEFSAASIGQRHSHRQGAALHKTKPRVV